MVTSAVPLLKTSAAMRQIYRNIAKLRTKASQGQHLKHLSLRLPGSMLIAARVQS